MNEDGLYGYSYSEDTYNENTAPARSVPSARSVPHSSMPVFRDDTSSLILNNGWNDQIEHDARLVGERSGGLRWMHNKTSSVFLKRYWIVTGFNILLSAIVVTFNSITGAECIDGTFDPYKIVSIVGGALIAIVTTYSSIKNYGARVTAHQVSEGNFQALFYTIKNQLHLNRRDRQFGKDFIEWVQKEYTDLSSNPDSPDIPGFVENDYLELIKDSDIAKYNDIEPIIIKQDSPPRPPNTRTNAHVQPKDHTRHRRRKNSNVNPQNKSRPRPRTEGDDNYTVTIPDGGELSAKDKWQLLRFYGK